MQAHSHNFKEQSNTNFKSAYAKDFTPKEGDYSNGLIKPQSGQNAIVFGNHQLPMVTTNNSDFTPKEATKNQVNNTLQQSSNLILGDKPQSM